ncbi:MAG: hypothetical protein IPK78_07030 [Rhodospirillales bacterium]|nr:hypothetical protein [Rhodospirillales bacterium]
MIVSRSLLAAFFVGSSLVAALPATHAESQDTPIYGRQLMTESEQRAYRQKMRTAVSAEEREQIRAQHHRDMQERAQARGVTLPDMPPAKGMSGQGPGGQGMGSGGGGGMRSGGRGMGPGGMGPGGGGGQ